MQHSNKVNKMKRQRPLRSQWEVVNKGHTGKPNHRKNANKEHEHEHEYYEEAM